MVIESPPRRTAKQLGFSLKEISELLALRVDPVESCAHVKSIAEDKISDIEMRVRTLQRMRRTLRKLINACEAKQATSDCPILDSLDKESRR